MSGSKVVLDAGPEASGLAGGGVAAFDHADPGVLGRGRHFLRQYPTTIPVLILLVAVATFAVVAGQRFLSPFNLSLVLQQVTVVGVLGIAETLVVLTAGIDLSVGAIMLLSSVIMGRLSVEYGLPVMLSLTLGLATGLACGVLNGLLVARSRLPPFIATLGTWSVYGALVILVSHSKSIRSQDVTNAAPLLQWLGTAIRLGGGIVLTFGSILMLCLAALVWVVLHRTAFGRHLHATGDDPAAADLAGVDTRSVLVATYGAAGLICGLAGWVLIGRIGAISPFGASSSNLDAVTAVVIGGTSLFGGRGSIMGTLVGALIVGVFRDGLALAGVDVLWQEFSVGTLIIVAVMADQWLRRASA